MVMELLEGWDDAPAVIGPAGTTTRAELRAGAATLAARLYALGLRRGDRLALWLPDGAGWLQCLFACARLGVLVVPISTRFTAAEARRVLTVAEPSVLVVPDSFLKTDFVGTARALQAELPFLREVVVAPAHALLDGAAGEAPQAGRPEDLLCIFSTSGTTGVPKLAPHDQASIARHARNVARFFGMQAGEATLAALPLYGVLGFIQAMATLGAGMRWISVPIYSAEACARAIDAHQVTHCFSSDQMFAEIMAVPGASLRSWRVGGYADFLGWGARVAAEAEARFGAKFLGLYGSSEGFALLAGRDWRAPLAQRTGNGGMPVGEGIAFRIGDPETGAELPKGQPGELQLRGYTLLPHYLNNAAATQAAFTADGWFRTGDLAVDEGGSFLYLARLKDSLRLRGYLVDPGEIEAHIAAHPAVAQCAVVGAKGGGAAEVAVAFVVLKDAADEAALLAHCKDGLATYKQPKRILIVPEIAANNGPNGIKIAKNVLREQAEKALA